MKHQEDNIHINVKTPQIEDMDSFNAQKAYLVTCSESIILGHGQGLENKRETQTDLEQIVMVRLKHLLLKNVETLGCCRSLRICILADNFITKINALIECIHLVKLDLKGNQITQLPGVVFWERLRRLQLLNLHDNSMATRTNIQGLAGCQNLTALTLYDTPLSLKGHYRHCIVNSIWSLKALDNYVISDEEIFENWCLPFRFKSLKPHFYTNLYPTFKTESYQSEMQAVHAIISDINRIQSLHSPTLIIQRYIRGYLTRKRLRLVRVVPCRRKIHLPAILSEETSGELTPRSQENQGESWVKECLVDKQPQRLEDRYVKIKRLFANPKGLLQTDSPMDDTSFASLEDRKQKVLGPPYNTPRHSKIIESRTSKHVDGEDLPDQDDILKEEHGTMTFRVRGFSALFHLADPLNDMLVSRRRGGQDIRRAVRHFHSQQPEPARLPRLRPPVISAEERLIGRCHASISMAPFKQIERAYLMRERAEALRSRTEHVTQRQARREDAQSRRLCLMDASRKEVVEEREIEREQVEEALALLKACRDREVEAARKRHADFVKEKQRLASERAWVWAFSRQHAVLTKAMSKHSTRQRQRDAQRERKDMADRCRTQAQNQSPLQGHRKQCVKDEAVTSHVETFIWQRIRTRSSSRPRPAGPV